LLLFYFMSSRKLWGSHSQKENPSDWNRTVYKQ